MLRVSLVFRIVPLIDLNKSPSRSLTYDTIITFIQAFPFSLLQNPMRSFALLTSSLRASKE